MHDDGHQPIAIGHLSDSGDLKNKATMIYQLPKKACKLTLNII